MSITSFVSHHPRALRGRDGTNADGRQPTVRMRRLRWMRHAADISALDNAYTAIEHHQKAPPPRAQGWQRPC